MPKIGKSIKKDGGWFSLYNLIIIVLTVASCVGFLIEQPSWISFAFLPITAPLMFIILYLVLSPVALLASALLKLSSD